MKDESIQEADAALFGLDQGRQGGDHDGSQQQMATFGQVRPRAHPSACLCLQFYTLVER